MGDAHKMVIHHIGKIVGRIAVRLNKNHIVQLRVRHFNLPVDLIHKSGRALSRHILTDHIGNTCLQFCFNLLLRQMKAMLIIHHNLLAGHILAQRLQTLLITEAVISLPFFNQLLGILQIDSGSLALTLNVGSYAPVLIRPFIVNQACLCQSAVNNIYCALHIALLIRILNSQHKAAILMFGNQIRIQCCSQISHMHPPGGAGCKSCFYLRHFLILLLFSMINAQFCQGKILASRYASARQTPIEIQSA